MIDMPEATGVASSPAAEGMSGMVARWLRIRAMEFADRASGRQSGLQRDVHSLFGVARCVECREVFEPVDLRAAAGRVPQRGEEGLLDVVAAEEQPAAVLIPSSQPGPPTGANQPVRLKNPRWSPPSMPSRKLCACSM